MNTQRQVDVRVIRARSALVMRHPFFGALAMRLTPIERSDIPTMATDGKHLFYSTAFLNKIDERTLIFVIVHEVLHCALGHHTRRNGRDHMQWNKACDYVINKMAKDAAFAIPDWVLLDPKFDGLNADQVYKMMTAPPPPQKDQDQPDDSNDDEQQDGDDGEKDEDQESEDQSDDENESDRQDEDSDDGDNSDEDGDDGDETEGDGDGDEDEDGDEGQPSKDAGQNNGDQDQGEGDGDGDQDDDADGDETSGDYPASHGDPGGCGEIMDAAPEHDKAALAEAADEWETFTRQAVNIARRQGEGRVPGFVEEIVNELDDPRVDWRDVLRRFVDPSNTKDYSWSNPNRRLMSMGHYTPGLISDGTNHIVLIIDTSGSIDQAQLKRFGGECQAALDDGAIDKVTTLFVDTRVNRVGEYAKGDQIDFTAQGRGGTAFSPAFNWINDNAQDVAAAIYFTDLDCSDFGDAPSYPVLWATYGFDPRQTQVLMQRVPFGECVELND